MEEKIKAMLDVGMADEQIKETLGVSDDDILKALGVTEEPLAKSPITKVLQKNPDVEKKRLVSVKVAQSKRSADTFAKYKPLLNAWNGSTYSFAIEYGIGQATAARIKRSATLEEYRASTKGKNDRYRQNKKEREQAEQTPEHQSNADRRADRKEAYEAQKKSKLPEPVVQERTEMPYTGRRADTHRPTKVTEEVFNNIKERFMGGETIRQIVDDTKLGRATVYRIIQADNIDEYFSKRDTERAKYGEPKKTEVSPELIELRTMNDYLARIVEALESKPKKRGWFRK